MLALGRALGETIAVTMVIGKGYFISSSLFKPGATAASQLASSGDPLIAFPLGWTHRRVVGAMRGEV